MSATINTIHDNEFGNPTLGSLMRTYNYLSDILETEFRLKAQEADEMSTDTKKLSQNPNRTVRRYQISAQQSWS